MVLDSEEASPSNVSKLFDSRVNCWSVMTETTVGRYLDLIETAYQQRGGLSHQREALKTASGRRIRARMVDDINRGAILPPVVIGVVPGQELLEALEETSWRDALEQLATKQGDSLAIIDGMQRTTALREAVALNEATKSRCMRVELWAAQSTDSLIYRMLILNTGQVPWNLKQQLQVVYEPLVKGLSENIKFGRFLGEKERRWKGGEFSADSLIEAYIAFGLRRTEVDTQESLADEFSRLDMAEALMSKKYDKYFYPVIQIMVDLDLAFSRFDPAPEIILDNGDADKSKNRREYARGRNIFDTQPSRIGFIVACAIYVLGRIGMDKTEQESDDRLTKLSSSFARLREKLDNLSADNLGSFLSLDTLAEKASKRPTSAVGRWERSFFESAFKVLIEENFEVPSLETCWRS
ncbi:hypothetical protein [Novosphingobium sp. MD-1]|uniref:hypothetical protein n=1 Tax=Novosphingobium sp. MD-1 TaxID=1630648 RepID=UPI000F7F9069|nr:hypothetical protein [Novosphingobium sp. MD-1]